MDSLLSLHIMSEAGPSTPRAASITDIPADSTRGFERWRRSISHFTGLGLSEDEQAERSRVRQEAKLDLDYARCEQWKEKMMTQSRSQSAWIRETLRLIRRQVR